MKIERIFQILAAILTAIAAYFFWMENKDGVFVSLVLAACSFFISIRFQAKARIREVKKQEDILRENQSDG